MSASYLPAAWRASMASCEQRAGLYSQNDDGNDDVCVSMCSYRAITRMTYMDVVSPLDVDEQASDVASEDLRGHISEVNLIRVGFRGSGDNSGRGASIWTYNVPKGLERGETPHHHKRSRHSRVKVPSRCRRAHLTRQDDERTARWRVMGKRRTTMASKIPIA